MMLAQHKLAIALVFSGLVHGLFFVSDSEHEIVADSLEHSNDIIHLEFVIAGQAVNDESILSDNLRRETESVVHQKVAKNVRTPDQLSKKAKPEDIQKHDEQITRGDGSYAQEKRLSNLDTDHNQLMKLVYRAISQHKRYPLMARRLRQQGKVTLNFIMHPNGQVTDVEVTKSSRYSVLDRAAKNAVVAISPLAMAADYLDDRKRFDVAVEFRLN